MFSDLTSRSSCTLPINNLPCDRPKESPTQQQQQISRLLNRRKSLDPVRFREIKRELFGSEEFSLKLDDDQPPPPPPGFPINQYQLNSIKLFHRNSGSVGNLEEFRSHLQNSDLRI